MKGFSVRNSRTIHVRSRAHQIIFNAMKCNKCSKLNFAVFVTWATDLWYSCNTEDVLGVAENIKFVSPSLFHKLLLLECNGNVN